MSTRKKRKKGQFCVFYNFYFELCKRLKVRMKENRKNFKFRKIYIRSKSATPARTVKTTAKKIVVRKKPARSTSKPRISKRANKIAEKDANLVSAFEP